MSHHYGYEDFKWKGHELHLNGECVCTIVPMFKFYWGGEGVMSISDDYYNIDRAKDNAIKTLVREYNEQNAGESL